MNKFIEPLNILMIDIETKDTKITAEIIEVAVVKTNARVTTDTMHYYLHSTQTCNDRFTYSDETLKFHSNNDTNVLENQLRATIQGTSIAPAELIPILNKLTTWMPSDTIVYCYGLSFDIPIINHLAIVTGQELYLPSYRNLRCLRTEVATAKSLGFKPNDKLTAHNARDDCANQLGLLFSIFDFYKGLTNGTNN